jgi:hypothetical protein
MEPLGAATLLAPATEGALPGAGEPSAAPATSSTVLPSTSLAAAAFVAVSSVALSSAAWPLHRDLLRGLLVSRSHHRGLLVELRWPSTEKLPQLLLQRLVLIGQYLIVIENDTHLFALVGGWSGAASSTARRGTTEATCRTAAYQDASTACWRAAP